MRIRRHDDSRCARRSGSLDQVGDETCRHSPPHPVGVDEQILEFNVTVGRETCRETHSDPVGLGEAEAPLDNGTRAQLEELWVSEEVLPVTVIRQRRCSEYLRQITVIIQTGTTDQHRSPPR